MTKVGNQRKAEQLGMPYDTAAYRLRRTVMFQLVQRLGLDTCIRCGELIESVEDFSIDHIQAWLNVDPDLFWDAGNVGFSHKSCNYRAAKRTGENIPHPVGEQHKDAKLTEENVRSIRQRYAAGKASGPSLAREYGVCHSAIYDVIYQRTWSHVQ